MIKWYIHVGVFSPDRADQDLHDKIMLKIKLYSGFMILFMRKQLQSYLLDEEIDRVTPVVDIVF